MGVSSVGKLLTQLKERGAIDYIGRRQRSIVILDAEPVPLVRLQAKLASRLARYCREHHEGQEAVVHDAVLFHLDAMEKEHADEAARALTAGGGG